MRDREPWSVSGTFLSIEDDSTMIVQNCAAWKLTTFRHNASNGADYGRIHSAESGVAYQHYRPRNCTTMTSDDQQQEEDNEVDYQSATPHPDFKYVGNNRREVTKNLRMEVLRHLSDKRNERKVLTTRPTMRQSLANIMPLLSSTSDDCKPIHLHDKNDGNHSMRTKKKATKQAMRERAHFVRHKSVATLTPTTKSQKDEARDDDSVKSLSCFVSGDDAAENQFDALRTPRLLSYNHVSCIEDAGSERKSGGDPSLDDAGRIQFQQKQDEKKVGSMRTTKLRRQNACRQKSSPTLPTVARSVVKCSQSARRNKDEAVKKVANERGLEGVDDHDVLDDREGDERISQTEVTAVRSRSLNHLDTLEMRQGNAQGASTSPTRIVDATHHLKDAKSEPDCTSTTTTTTSQPRLAPSASPSPTHRRHMLSRSQKSSSECFSVNFEVGDESTYDSELFFPAARGITLHESMSKLCELRNIELSACDVWLCDRETNAQSWLSLSQDTACLVGKHVKLTAKESSRILANKQGLAQVSSSNISGHSRKLSGNFRPRTTSFFSNSTEETGDYEGSKKMNKQRWSTNLFGNSKDSKQSMEQLIEHLNHYSRHGVPHSQNYSLSSTDSHEELNRLEDDWRMIIDSSDMNDKQQKQQTAVWELIKTEVAYIKTLKVVTDLFLACLLNLQASNILRDIDTNKLFSNINDILDANVQFWHMYLSPLVKDMRTYRRPACLETMCDGFLKLKDCFQAYYRFCGEQSRCQHYCRDNLSHNELFTAYLAWCETQKECNRLRLMDILVQPMQRLTKYGLLLKAILRNSDDELDRDNLNAMIRSVDDFVNSVNFSLKQKQDNERLKGIIARIETYDIVESKDDDLEKLVRNYNQLDLTKPMLHCGPERRRHLLLEGDLKLKDSSTSKMEVHCFLLTDMLLVCKQSTKKGGATMRVIRQPFLVDKLAVSEVHKETPTLACVYRNELDMAVAAFLLQNSDVRKLRAWKDGIAKAQTLYAHAKLAPQHHVPEESLEMVECSFECCSLESDVHSSLQAPRSPAATSSRASRVSSLAHSHSGSVEMNDQSSLGSSCRAMSADTDNRTASVSSDEGVPATTTTTTVDHQKSPSSGGSVKSAPQRIFGKTPNTLSVQPTYALHQPLGQSLPNLTLGSPSTTLTTSLHTLSVPAATRNGGHLLSPTHRGISYPPPSPTRANLRRGMAINQSKNPPLIKTRHITSSTSTSAPCGGGGGEFDVPVIAAFGGEFGDFSRGQHRQAMKRAHRNDHRRYHTAGTVDDIKNEDNKESSNSILKRSSWNCSSTQSPNSNRMQIQNQGNNDEQS